MDRYLTLLELAFATSATSITVARSHMTKPLRHWANRTNLWLGLLLGCPYCLSHWFALAMAMLMPYDGLLWFGVHVMAIVGVSAVITGAAFKLIHWDQAEVNELIRSMNAGAKEESGGVA